MREHRDEWTLDVSHLLKRARRRWRVIALAAVVGLVAAAAAGAITPREYSATASVAVSPIRLPNQTAVQQINVDTERAVMLSREVAVLAAKDLGAGVDADALVESSSVAAPEGSEVLQVSVTASTPQQAAGRADAMANAYLQFRAKTALQIAAPAIDALNARIFAQPDASAGTLADLRGQRTALQHVGDAVGQVIGKAVVPTSPSSLGLPVYLVAGLAAGLLAGLVLALLRDRLDSRVRDAERLTELTGRSAVVLGRSQDEDALRWLLRILLTAPERRGGGLVVVGVVGDDPEPVARLLRRLTAFAPTVGRSVRVVPAGRLQGEVLDHSFLVDTEPGDQIVLVDGSGVTSPARRAALLEAVDAVMVVAGGRSRRRVLGDLLEPLSGSDSGSIIPVLVEGASTRGPVARPVTIALPRGETRVG